MAGQLDALAKIPVDVRVLNFAPIRFLFHVIKGNLLVNKDDDAGRRFTEQVIRRYLDMKPLVDRAFEEAVSP